jgi:hypothetical protein
MDNLLTVLLLVAAASGGNILKDNEKLRFDVTASRSIEEPPTIEVRFANGVKDTLALKHYRMNEHSVVACNYLGHLRNSPSSSVAVTGCLNKPGDRMEVTLISDNNINKMFSVDFNGNAEIINNPFEEGALSRALPVDGTFDDQQGDEILNDAEEELSQTAAVTAIPSKLKATIKFGYENGLNEELGSVDFNVWIADVFTHTQAHFRHAASLGTTIEFEVQGSALYNEGATWTADDNIRDARAATLSANLEGVDTMSWWCKRGGGGVAGIAYVGAICMSYNTNLNEKQSNAANSGFVLAHELGHNFGMSHDFDAKHGGHSGPCNGQGIMSYGSYDYDQWSTCSKSDWEEHYSAENWGREGCLEDISDSNEETTVAPTTEAPTDECNTEAICAIANCDAPNAGQLCPNNCGDVCKNIKIVTKNWGKENSWTLGDCNSAQEYKSFKGYTEECCQRAGNYQLACKDTYKDGWHGGYMEIAGEKYCETFRSGHLQTEEVTF